MQALRPRLLGRRDDGLAVEITRNLQRLVGQPRELARRVGRRSHRDGLQPEPLGGGDDAAGDLAAIGDQDIGEQTNLP